MRVGAATLKSAPDAQAGQASQCLFGEVFTVYEEKDGWSWGQAVSDSYVGYVPTDTLRDDIAEPTHRVVALASHLYPEPDFKRPPLDILPMGAEVAVRAGADERFVELATDGYMVRRHLMALTDTDPDYVTTAERMIGIPYLWGGKSTTMGLDCSGLVQIALALAGHKVLRDSDMQAETIGDGLPEGLDLRRGDIVCFPGHIGFLWNEIMLLHANAYQMGVSKDPLADVIERVRAEQASSQTPKPPVTCIRRIAP
ncbi:MAG TPA: NlpC/P60 family protein [Alphaproteobacteria bacterium]|nr:NlpC/P60 family protein [Alphaproteobacteria bacterium]